MAATPGSISISILGRDYQIACPPEEEDALRRAARHLDQQMEDLRRRGASLGYDKIAVLAALNISHELLKRSRDVNSIESDAQREIKLLERKIDTVLASSKQIELQ